MNFGELKWTDIRDADKAKVVILPLASMEQHGQHLPLLTDTILTTGVVEGVEKQIGQEALILPVLWLGASHHHLDFPGTVSLDSDLYTQVLCQALDCLINAGFRKIFLLNGHGGNMVPGSAAVTKARLKHSDIDPLFLVICCYWEVASQAIAAIEEMQTPRLTHACEYETSMCLFLRPELVAMDKAVGVGSRLNSDFCSPDEWAPSRVSLALSFRDLSNTGAMGRPDLSTKEKGRKLIDAVVTEVVAFIKDFGNWKKIIHTPNPPLP